MSSDGIDERQDLFNRVSMDLIGFIICCLCACFALDLRIFKAFLVSH